MRRRIAALVLCFALVLSMACLLAGCESAAAQEADLMAGVEPNAVDSDVDLTGEGAAAMTDFGVRLFQQGMTQGKNSLISPLSVICALAMTANGAKEETLTQMEAAFGMPIAELNEYLHAYMEQLPEAEKYKLSMANAIWFKDVPSFVVEPGFLQANADHYGAGVYRAPFDDSTCKEINSWVEENTDGMIRDILDSIPREAVMYLVNALAFDAEWKNIYQEDEVRGGTFTKEDGTVRDVELMYATERLYLEDDDAVGFVKPYADGKYAFAALLPNEGTGLADYVADLTGERLRKLLADPRESVVRTAIPKFESDYSIELSAALQQMGIELAFGGGDLSGIGASSEGPLAISSVLHKTYIAVDEKGTKAGAATAVEFQPTSAVMPPDLQVILDRPFVYLIVDLNTNIPVFIGTVSDVG